MRSTRKKLPTPMFHASTRKRGNQIRTSGRPRIVSRQKKVNRPICAATPMTQLAHGRRDPARGRLPFSRVRVLVAAVIGEVSCPPMPDKSRPRVADDAREFRRRLLRWFRRHGRDLPWRRTRDPYRVAVSEFMLQQTQVSRVEGFYARLPGPLPHRSSPGRRPARRRARGLGRTGLLPPRAQPARPGTRGGDHPRRTSSPTTLSSSANCPAWEGIPPARSPVSPSSDARRRWTPTSPASFAAPSIPARRRTAARRGPHLEDGAGARPPPRPRRVVVQSGDHGAGSADLYGEGGAV